MAGPVWGHFSLVVLCCRGAGAILCNQARLTCFEQKSHAAHCVLVHWPSLASSGYLSKMSRHQSKHAGASSESSCVTGAGTGLACAEESAEESGLSQDG